MDNIWMIGEILLGFYLAGFALMTLAHLFFLSAFWGELRHSGHATVATALDIVLGSILSGARWPQIVYQGFRNARHSG